MGGEVKVVHCLVRLQFKGKRELHNIMAACIPFPKPLSSLLERNFRVLVPSSDRRRTISSIYQLALYC